MGRSWLTYEEACENAVLPRQVIYALLLGQGGHHVEQRSEARHFHHHPADAAGDVEAAGDGGLAHAVPRDGDLEEGDLGNVSDTFHSVIHSHVTTAETQHSAGERGRVRLETHTASNSRSIPNSPAWAVTSPQRWP